MSYVVVNIGFIFLMVGAVALNNIILLVHIGFMLMFSNMMEIISRLPTKE